MEAVSDGESEDDLIARLDRARALVALGCALAMLPVADRTVLLWKYQDGATNKTIAAALGVSEGTAKRRASAALAAVQCALRERGSGREKPGSEGP